MKKPEHQDPGLLKMIWDEIVWKGEDVCDYIAYKAHGLSLIFERAAFKASLFLDDLYWKILDPVVEMAEKFNRQIRGIEEDGSIKLASSVYLYLPEPVLQKTEEEKRKELFRKARIEAIDADFIDAPAPH